MNHPLYYHLHEVTNDSSAEDIFKEVVDYTEFKWVSAYVFSDKGLLAIQHIPKSNRYKQGIVQSFGGNDCDRNLLFMMNKLRLELLDESGIGLSQDVKFVSSPMYVIGYGLVQAFMVPNDWLIEQGLWSPERARNTHGAVPNMYDISQWWDYLQSNDDVKEALRKNPSHQIIRLVSLHDAVELAKLPWRPCDYDSLELLLPTIYEMLSHGMTYNSGSVHLEILDGLSERMVSFLCTYNDRAVRHSSFHALMKCIHLPWLPLLKYEALVTTKYSFLVHSFKNRNYTSANELRRDRASDLQGGLVAVWRGTITRADAHLKKLSEQSSRDLDQDEGINKLENWLTERDVVKFLGPPTSTTEPSGICSEDGVWMECDYTHPDQPLRCDTWKTA